MRNLRERYTYSERLEFQDTITSLRPYLLVVLLKRQGGRCDICKEISHKYDIDHRLYNPMQTARELRALCEACHKSVTDYRPMRNRTR